MKKYLLEKVNLINEISFDFRSTNTLILKIKKYKEQGIELNLRTKDAF